MSYAALRAMPNSWAGQGQDAVVFQQHRALGLHLLGLCQAGGLQLGGAGAGCDFGVLLGGGALGLARAVDHQHDLALDARALPLARGERVAHLGQPTPHHFLVQLRQLAAHGDLAVRKRFRQRGQGRHQAVRALVEQQRRIERAQALHHR